MNFVVSDGEKQKRIKKKNWFKMPYYVALSMPFMLKCCQFQPQNTLEFESGGCFKIFSGSLPCNVNKSVSPKQIVRCLEIFCIFISTSNLGSDNPIGPSVDLCLTGLIQSFFCYTIFRCCWIYFPRGGVSGTNWLPVFIYRNNLISNMSSSTKMPCR